MTPPSNTIEELVGRVESATGPDREIDRAIFSAIVDPRIEKNFYIWQSSRPQGTPPRPDASYWDHRHTPEVTASIDAALALAERVLSGWRWSVGAAGIKTGELTPEGYPRYGAGFKAVLTECSALHTMPVVTTAATAPLAIILATLRALRIKGDANEA